MLDKCKRDYYHAVRNLETSVIDRIEAGTHDDTPHMNVCRALYIKMREHEKAEGQIAEGARRVCVSL